MKLRFLCNAMLAAVLPVTASAASPAPAGQVQALHLLNRLGYGPRPGDLERVAALGPQRYIEQQLQPETLAEPSDLQQKLAVFETLGLSPAAAFSRYNPRSADGGKLAEGRQLSKDFRHQTFDELQAARLLRATESPRQLQEVMVDFWFNHFNIYSNKSLDLIWVGPFERDAIRPHAFGKFRDLLGATAHHPAMLFYLDNFLSRAAGIDGRGRPFGLNENYARELMELHTLGVDGGYTQHDVTELARILTGWTFDKRAMLSDPTSGFVFNERLHDRGEKTFLGQKFAAGGGEEEGERALDMLASSPATARHIATLLVRRFVADTPPPALVERVAKRFQSSGGDIRDTLREVLTSAEFRSDSSIASKFKTPYEYVISAVRAVDFSTDRPQPVLNALRALGMPLYGCLTPNGYDDTREAWLNPAAMLRRINFAVALGSGRLPVRSEAEDKHGDGEPDATAVPDVGGAPDSTALLITLGPEISAESRARIADAPAPLRAALALGGPDFMRR